MNGPTMEALAQRLEKMEQQNRKLKRVGGGVLALAVAGMVMGQAMPRVRMVEAEGFALKDAAGKVRAGLGMDKDGPVLFLADENGKLRGVLAVGKGGPRLALRYENGKLRGVLAVGKGGPNLHLYDENGKVMWSEP